MKKTSFTLVLTMLLMAAFLPLAANDNSEMPRIAKKAEQSFLSMDYFDALDLFLNAHEKFPENPFIQRRIADCYRLLGMEEEALQWYEQSVTAGPFDALDYYYGAQVLKSMGQDEQALSWIDRFFEASPEDSRAEKLKNDPYYFKALLTQEPAFNAASMGANANRSVGSPTKTEELLLVPIAGGVDGEWFPHRRYLLDYDLFETSVDEMFNLVAAEPAKGEINSYYSEGPSCYDKNRGILYVTRFFVKEQTPVIDQSAHVASAIVSFELINGLWKTTKDFAFHVDGFSTAYPAISPDGRHLYFCSNHDGNGFDIYRAERTSKGWSEPVRLDGNINTEGNEIYPSFSPKGEFVFASDGHPGLGGIDIFFGFPNEMKEPINPGMPVNSRDDDFGMMFIGDEFGYFCSDRDVTGGGDDLFWWENWHEVIEAEIVLMTPDGMPMNPEDVTIRNLRNQEEQHKSGKRGSFIAALNGSDLYEISWRSQDQLYTMHLSPQRTPMGLRYAYDSPMKQKFLADAQVITYKESAFRKKKLPGEKWKDRNLTDQTFYAYQSNGEKSFFRTSWDLRPDLSPEPGTRVFLKNMESGAASYFDVGNNLTAEFEIAENQLHLMAWRTADGREHKAFFTPDGEDVAFADGESVFTFEYSAEPVLMAATLDEKEFSSVYTASADDEFGRVGAGEILTFAGGVAAVRKTPAGVSMKSGAIYFGFDSYNLSAAEQSKLAEIIAMMMDQPDLRISIQAHTDSRGDHNYNMLLSKRRATAIQKMLIDAGIEASRIDSEWTGETQLTNHCADDVYCTPAQHRMNRRAELTLLLPDNA